MNRVARKLVLAVVLAAGTTLGAASVATPVAWAQAEPGTKGKKAARGKKATQGKKGAQGKKGQAAAPAAPEAPLPGPTLGGDPEPAPCNPGADGEGGQFHVEEQDGQKVYVIDKAITVCGKVPRPLVAYVLQPRSINWEFEGMKQEFLPKIRESVKKAPF